MYSSYYKSSDKQNERITFCQSLHYQLLKVGSIDGARWVAYLTELSKQPGRLTALCENISAKWVLLIQDPVQKEPSIKEWRGYQNLQYSQKISVYRKALSGSCQKKFYALKTHM